MAQNLKICNNLYCNNTKYWDSEAIANCVDPDQTPHSVYTVCHTYSNKTHQEVVEWTISTFRTSMISRSDKVQTV